MEYGYEDDDYQEGGDNALPDLQWNDEFYDAVDQSIYRAVGEAMPPLEQRLTQRIDQALACLTALPRAPTPQWAAPTPQTTTPDTGPPPPKHPRNAGMDADADAFDSLKKALLASQPLTLPSDAVVPPLDPSSFDDATPGPPQPAIGSPQAVSDMFDPDEIVRPTGLQRIKLRSMWPCVSANLWRAPVPRWMTRSPSRRI